MRRSTILTAVVAFAIGGTTGAYLFSDTQPRSFLAITRCEDCLAPSELAGLLASVGIQKTPGLLPGLVLETDRSVVVRHPRPSARIHYVILPKKDIRDVADIPAEGRDFLIDVFGVAGELVRKEKLSRYRILTNGPGYQDVNYLHFHLVGS
jgi:histidine triad (HIT) family protein